MQALIAAVLPMLVNALSSVLGKSVSEFNALPRSERPAKLRAVLRSKWMLTSPPAAIAARALAATDAGVNAAVNALEKYGSGAVALGTEAAHAAAEKHLAKNPRSGGRMARVRIAPSIPSYALDRLDVTRARRNGYSRRRNCGGDCACAPCQAAARSNPLSVVGGAGPFPEGMVVEHPGVKPMARLKAAINRIDIARTSSEAHRAYGQAHRVYESLKRAGVYIHPSLFNDIGFSYTDKLRSIPPTPEELLEAEKARLYPPRKRGARRNTMGAFAEYDRKEAAILSNLRVLATALRALPYGMAAAAEDLDRIIAQSKHGSFGLHKLKQIEAEYAAKLSAESAAQRTNPAARRNHHIRVGGTFYTPGGRRGTVLAEARDGYYRVRWSDGTVGTVQDNEWAAYPTAGSRANRGAARSNSTETKYYTYRLYFGKATPRKWAGDFSTREQAQEKADEMIGEYGEPSDGIRIVKFRAQLRRK